jgi:SAM-dependent methyltransferase
MLGGLGLRNFRPAIPYERSLDRTPIRRLVWRAPSGVGAFMGIHLNLAVLLGDIVSRHRLRGRVLTLGEQSLTFDPERIAQSSNRPPSSASLTAQSPAAQLFARLGLAATESLDIDAVAGATHLFDLNRGDTPEPLVGRFDLVVNGGVLEHVFHLPNALAHITRMLREDGVALHVLPCNNWADHGFYQFSPTLMFDYYRAAGFECLESMLLGSTPGQPDRWSVRCATIGLLGEGLAGALDENVYLHLFAARRGRTADPNPIPQQGLYAPADTVMRPGSRPRWFAPYLLNDGLRQEILPRAELTLSTEDLAHESGYAWTTRIGGLAALADTLDRPARSPLVLLEDGVPLGPAHAPYAQIRSRGYGRYSHWGEQLCFASSDNSAPNTNGRRYVIVAAGITELADLSSPAL